MSIFVKARHIITEYTSTHSDITKEMNETADALRLACTKIENSWSGSFAGWHGSMYYKDFQKPSVSKMFSGEWGGIHGIPDGWAEKQPDEVIKALELIVGNNFVAKEFENRVSGLRATLEEAKKELVILFSAFTFDKRTEKEKEIYSQLENFKFGKSHGAFNTELRPKQIMTRDTKAAQQGIANPVWLYYESVALEAESIIESQKEFISLTDRLIRQLELKSGATASVESSNLINLHPEIIAKCDHLYASGAYPEAVEKGFKVVRDKLRVLTGHETGSEAFGKGKLHIKGAAAANVDADFNEGVKFLTMAIDRFRNEKAHTSDAKIDDPERAHDYLRLSSLAMKLLDAGEIIP